MSITFSHSISCFNHCSKLVFYKNFPNYCPVCKQSLTNFITQPFQLSFPFVSGSQSPVSIIIRPSQGTFLDYNINNDLHIGIVDSESNIFEFDKLGIVKNDFQMWKSCIAVNIVPESWYDHWDNILYKTISSPIWNSANYHENSLNCFNFVITFLNNLKYQDIEFSNKEDICEKFILSKINEVMRYTVIHKKLLENDFYIQN